jgi:hypothetical protein
MWTEFFLVEPMVKEVVIDVALSIYKSVLFLFIFLNRWGCCFEYCCHFFIDFYCFLNNVCVLVVVMWVFCSLWELLLSEFVTFSMTGLLKLVLRFGSRSCPFREFLGVLAFYWVDIQKHFINNRQLQGAKQAINEGKFVVHWQQPAEHWPKRSLNCDLQLLGSLHSKSS